MKKKFNKKAAMDPGTVAALAVGANNLLLAHSHKIPGVKHVIKHTRDAAYHAGFKNGVNGEKGVGAAARNLWKIKDLYHSSVYEKGMEHGRKYKNLQEEVKKRMPPGTKSVDVDYDSIKKHYGHHLRHILDSDDQRTLENAVGHAPSRLQHHMNRAARIATADLTPERRQRIKKYVSGGFVPDAKKAISSVRSGVNQIGGNIAHRIGGEKARAISQSNISDLWKKKKTNQ